MPPIVNERTALRRQRTNDVWIVERQLFPGAVAQSTRKMTRRPSQNGQERTSESIVLQSKTHSMATGDGAKGRQYADS
jgi:hypothetical protein